MKNKIPNYRASIQNFAKAGNVKEVMEAVEGMIRHAYDLGRAGEFLCPSEEKTEGTMQEEFEKQQKESRVSHPPYYTWLKDLCGVEVIDITRHMDFNLGNCLKYILRSNRKHEEGMSDKAKAIEDLKKARWYLDDEIRMLENN